MARTKSQKAKRYARQTAARLAKAAQTRELVQAERVQVRSLARATYCQAIQQGAESKHAARVRVHHERVSYHALDDDKLHKRTRREALPLVRIQTTTRADSKAKIAARVLQTYHRVAREQGISKQDMLRHFRAERPADAELLKV